MAIRAEPAEPRRRDEGVESVPPVTPPSHPSSRRWVWLAGGLVAVAVAALLGGSALARRDPPPTTEIADPGTTTSSSSTTSSRPERSTSSTRRVTTTAAQPASGPPFGTWIAQLESVPVGAGRERLDALLAAVRAAVPEAAVLESDHYGSMRSGYWVIYHPGPFATGLDAMGLCVARGLAMPSHCLGRRLTPDPADLVRSQCYRSDDGDLTEGCSV